MIAHPMEQYPSLEHKDAPDHTSIAASSNTHSLNLQVDKETLLKMQERIAWLEANLADANNLIDELFLKVDKLERQLRYLASITEAPSVVRPLSEETPPPHY